MDTGSHLLFGVTLGGLALIDHNVASNPELAQAIMAGTIIGSNAPDFDTVTRLKGFKNYIKYHRGISHSIPALIIWALLISIPLSQIFNVQNHWPYLFLWSFTAVSFHVFLDLLNSYGVQILQPFQTERYRLDFLSIFEPFLFLLHFIGVVFWLVSDYAPGKIFFTVYLITFVYIGLRYLQHKVLINNLSSELKINGNYYVFPNFNWLKWRFTIETTDSFYAGKVKSKKIILEDIYPKQERTNPVIQATMATDGVRTFLKFAQGTHVTYKKIYDGYEVQWSDIRFWYNRKLPFGVDVLLDKELNVVNQDLRWRKKAWDPPYV